MKARTSILRTALVATSLVGSLDAARAQTTWRRTYGGFDSNVGRSIRQTDDGGYILAGSTGSFGASGQAYVLKLDSSGLVEWTSIFGDNGVQEGMACRIVADGYILAGTTTTGDFGGYDLYLVRLDGEGQVLWERSYGTGAWDIGSDVEVLTDGFVLAGTTYSNGVGDAYVVRTDLSGDALWTRTFGMAGEDVVMGVFATVGGDAIITGSQQQGTDDDPDGFISRLASDGDIMWTATFGGDSVDYLHSAVETTDGGFVCSGGTNSFLNVKQILLVKVDANGAGLWQEVFGSMGDSEGREIQLTQNGDFAIASYNSYNNAGGKDMVLFIASSTGDFLLGKNYGGLDDEYGYSIESTSDGGYITIGTAEGYGPGFRSIYVVKGDPTGETADDTVYEMFDDSAISDGGGANATRSIFPNPATTSIRFASIAALTSAHLLDPQGRLSREWRKPLPQDLDLRGLSPGAYQLVTTNEAGGRAAQTLIVAAP